MLNRRLRLRSQRAAGGPRRPRSLHLAITVLFLFAQLTPVLAAAEALIYVARPHRADFVVVDREAETTLLAVPTGEKPSFIVVEPAGRFAYAGGPATDTVVLRTLDNKPNGQVSRGNSAIRSATDVVFHPAAPIAYVATPDTLYQVDTQSHEVIANVSGNFGELVLMADLGILVTLVNGDVGLFEASDLSPFAAGSDNGLPDQVIDMAASEDGFLYLLAGPNLYRSALEYQVVQPGMPPLFGRIEQMPISSPMDHLETLDAGRVALAGDDTVILIEYFSCGSGTGGCNPPSTPVEVDVSDLEGVSGLRRSADGGEVYAVGRRDLAVIDTASGEYLTRFRVWSGGGTLAGIAVLPTVESCSARSTSLTALSQELRTLDTSSQTIGKLVSQLKKVGTSLAGGDVPTARLDMKNFISSAVWRSNLDPRVANSVAHDEISSVLCGAGNLLARMRPQCTVGICNF